jgi:probable HAF family extracellular repeat protein
MNSKKLQSSFWMMMLALAFSAVSSAQNSPAESKQQHNYKLMDLGTFGGPNSLYFSAPVVQSVNNRGIVVGAADTSIPDPTCFYDCNILHAFAWQKGALTDLGTLPGGANSIAFWVNEQRDCRHRASPEWVTTRHPFGSLRLKQIPF